MRILEEGRGVEPPSGEHPGATVFGTVRRPLGGTFLEEGAGFEPSGALIESRLVSSEVL